MARPPSQHPTDTEMKILNVLWKAKGQPLELGQICAELTQQSGQPVVTTTIASVLGVMLKKRLVRRRRGQRAYLWSPVPEQDRIEGGMLRKLKDIAFRGSASQMITRLIEEEPMSDKELELIHQKIMEIRRGRGGLG